VTSRRGPPDAARLRRRQLHGRPRFRLYRRLRLGRPGRRLRRDPGGEADGRRLPGDLGLGPAAGHAHHRGELPDGGRDADDPQGHRAFGRYPDGRNGHRGHDRPGLCRGRRRRVPLDGRGRAGDPGGDRDGRRRGLRRRPHRDRRARRGRRRQPDGRPRHPDDRRRGPARGREQPLRRGQRRHRPHEPRPRRHGDSAALPARSPVRPGLRLRQPVCPPVPAGYPLPRQPRPVLAAGRDRRAGHRLLLGRLDEADRLAGRLPRLGRLRRLARAALGVRPQGHRQSLERRGEHQFRRHLHGRRRRVDPRGDPVGWCQRLHVHQWRVRRHDRVGRAADAGGREQRPGQPLRDGVGPLQRLRRPGGAAGLGRGPARLRRGHPDERVHPRAGVQRVRPERPRLRLPQRLHHPRRRADPRPLPLGLPVQPGQLAALLAPRRAARGE
jgi:hypothetical protein